MTLWHTPRFQELAMNAEIGGYQPEFDDGQRETDVPFVARAGEKLQRTAQQASDRGLRAPQPQALREANRILWQPLPLAAFGL